MRIYCQNSQKCWHNRRAQAGRAAELWHSGSTPLLGTIINPKTVKLWTREQLLADCKDARENINKTAKKYSETVYYIK